MRWCAARSRATSRAREGSRPSGAPATRSRRAAGAACSAALVLQPVGEQLLRLLGALLVVLDRLVEQFLELVVALVVGVRGVLPELVDVLQRLLQERHEVVVLVLRRALSHANLPWIGCRTILAYPAFGAVIA